MSYNLAHAEVNVNVPEELRVMHKISAYLCQITEGQILTRERAKAVFLEILKKDSNVMNFYWGLLFGGLQTRGPDIQETLGFLDAILEFDETLRWHLSNKALLSREKPVIAIAGSGKETFKTFNVSTCAAFIASACGVLVVKPCSRSTSAVSGSTDVLEALGINLPQTQEAAKLFSEKTGICFFDYSNAAPTYAKRYDGLLHHFHPLSYIVPPMFIPFQLDGLVYGISNQNVSYCASLLREIGYKKAFIVSGALENSLSVDEYLHFGTTHLAEIRNGSVETQILKNPEPTPEQLHSLRQTRQHESNAGIITEVLENRAASFVTDLACWNAALILNLADQAETIPDGYHRAIQAIQDGSARKKLEECRAV